MLAMPIALVGIVVVVVVATTEGYLIDKLN